MSSMSSKKMCKTSTSNKCSAQICKIIVHLCLLVTICLPVVNASYDFCNYNCKTEQHILCMRKDLNCTPNPTKCKDITKTYLSLNARQWLLDSFNDLRNMLALGKLGKFPSATNMKAMRWCFELEYIAQCVANECHKVTAYKCLPTRNYVVRRFICNYDRNMDDKQEIWKYVNESYFDEGETVIVPDHIDNNPGTPKPLFDVMACSHMDKLGCGHIKYTNVDGEKAQLVVCCFAGAPKPFVPCEQGQPIYERGTPCTRCEASACNKKYPGLCGDTLPIGMELGVRYREDDRVNIAARRQQWTKHQMYLCIITIFCLYLLV